MRPSQLFAAVLAMSSVAAAMPDAFGGINALDVGNLLFGRQNNDNQESTSAAPKSTAASDEPASTTAPKATDKTSATDNASATDKDGNDNDQASTTAKATGTGKASGTGTKTTTKGGKSYDARLPAGGVTMVTPGALAGAQYYKVGDWVTFAWNYTSLSVTPTALDILATCTANQATYTIAVNQSAKQTSVLWDTGNAPDGQAPFLTEKYTLLIYDADSSATAAPRAGYLAPFNLLSFGMYTPQPYVDLADFSCPNCNTNSAFSHFEKMTFKALMVTSGTTLASLLYFSHNFGLL